MQPKTSISSRKPTKKIRKPKIKKSINLDNKLSHNTTKAKWVWIPKQEQNSKSKTTPKKVIQVNHLMMNNSENNSIINRDEEKIDLHQSIDEDIDAVFEKLAIQYNYKNVEINTLDDSVINDESNNTLMCYNIESLTENDLENLSP